MLDLTPGNWPDLEIESYMTTKRKYYFYPATDSLSTFYWSHIFIWEANFLK